MKRKKQAENLLVKRRKRELTDFSPNELEDFRVTQPTEEDMEEELAILRHQGLGDDE